MFVNTKHYNYVYTIAKVGSFSKAAEYLNVKQPSLSQYIKNIEKELGLSIFDRTVGGVKLTEAGKAFIDYGRKMLDLDHQFEEKISALSAYKAGTLIIGISAHRSVAFMPEIVKVFSKKYPGIILQIKEKKRHEILEAAEYGEFDLCITTLPLDNKLFEYQTVMYDESVIAIPQSLVIEKQISSINNVYTNCKSKFPIIKASVLDSMDFILLEENHPMHFELEELCSKHHLHIEPKVICAGLETALEMVRYGLGAAFIPTCLAKPIEGITYFSIEENKDRLYNREIVVMQRKNQAYSQIIDDLKNTILEVLSTK